MKLTNTARFHVFATLSLVAFNGLTTQHRVIADDGMAGDGFGYSAAIDGKTLLVGAFKADIDGLADAGAAYVYELTDNGWHQQAKLIAEPSFAEDTLGGKVALNNDVAMLGVMLRDDKGKDAGAVVSFERESDTWVQRQIFTAADAKPGDAFGQSIALSDRFLVIGAPRNDALGQDAGAAYIYKRFGSSWHYQTKLTASDGAPGDLFGVSAAVDGNTVLIGADLHDGRANNAGAVYVFVAEDDMWQQQAKLEASDGGDTDIFGVRVAISVNTALISARRDDIDGLGVDAGSAYIFERDGTAWSEKMKLISPDGKGDDRFGRGVAISNDTAIVSAMHHDANGANTGAVYVYKNHTSGWRYVSKIVANNSMPDDRFGWNVGLSDGLAVVATPFHDANGQDAGAVFIHDLSSDKK